jgi:hypothetical protein
MRWCRRPEPRRVTLWRPRQRLQTHPRRWPLAAAPPARREARWARRSRAAAPCAPGQEAKSAPGFKHAQTAGGFARHAGTAAARTHSNPSSSSWMAPVRGLGAGGGSRGRRSAERSGVAVTARALLRGADAERPNATAAGGPRRRGGVPHARPLPAPRHGGGAPASPDSASGPGLGAPAGSAKCTCSRRAGGAAMATTPPQRTQRERVGSGARLPEMDDDRHIDQARFRRSCAALRVCWQAAGCCWRKRGRQSLFSIA